MTPPTDVIILGAGIIGAATAHFAAQAGLSVTVVDKGLPASGTSSRCEGNALVSDKEPGPELDLARYSLETWKGDLAEHAELWEFQEKGGVIVATTPEAAEGLADLTAGQRDQGTDAQDLSLSELLDLEPHVTPAATGSAYYPEDAQLQPILAATHLLRLAREAGATVLVNSPVTGFLREGERVIGVRTPGQDLFGGAVINATGTWAGELAELAGVHVPVMPRRGYVLVTEPLPKRVFHKVYAADYVGDVGSSDASLQSSAVVEDTPAGTILIGSSRERVGFDDSLSPEALGMIGAGAIELFPFMGQVNILRHYFGFRPYCPDHLPVIGPDPRAPGLWHAAGHEGAGIGLSAGTGKLLVQALTGAATDLPLEPFRPERFSEDS